MYGVFIYDQWAPTNQLLRTTPPRGEGEYPDTRAWPKAEAVFFPCAEENGENLEGAYPHLERISSARLLSSKESGSTKQAKSRAMDNQGGCMEEENFEISESARMQRLESPRVWVGSHALSQDFFTKLGYGANYDRHARHPSAQSCARWSKRAAVAAAAWRSVACGDEPCWPCSAPAKKIPVAKVKRSRT